MSSAIISSYNTKDKIFLCQSLLDCLELNTEDAKKTWNANIENIRNNQDLVKFFSTIIDIEGEYPLHNSDYDCKKITSNNYKENLLESLNFR